MAINNVVLTGSFKSCPREGASTLSTVFSKGVRVSSHAPVRGHPHNLSLWVRRVELVSSHAPVRGHLANLKYAIAARLKFQVMPP